MFKLQRIPLQIELLLSELQSFFNDYQWLHFRSLLLSILITPYKATLNGMVRVLSFGSHRSKHNEFLNDCHNILSKVLQYYAMQILSLLEKHGEPIYLIVDDTTNKKRGKHILAAFNFFDHVSKQYIFGQQLVCAIIEYRKIIIPFSIEIYIPKGEERIDNFTFRKKTAIALAFLERFEVDDNQTVYVIADTYYATTGILWLCREKGYIFVSSLKSNRILMLNNKQINLKTYLRQNFYRKSHKKKIKLGRAKYQVLSQKVSLKTGGAVRIVCTRNESHRTAKVLFTTNLALPAYEILRVYQKRWSIEVFFKMSKQYLGLKAYQNRNLTAVTSAVTLSMISYNLLTHVFITENRAKGKRLTTKYIAQFNVLRIRDRIRHIAHTDSIDYCIEQNSNKSKNKLIKEIKSMSLAA